MKRIGSAMSALLGLAGLVILAGALVVVFNAMRGRPQSGSGLFHSPVESLPSPLETPAPSGRPTPVGQPAVPPAMATKAAVAVLAQRQTPRPQPTLRPIRNSQDIIDAVLTDPGFQANLDDPIFGPNSKGATPGEPIFVKSLNPNKWDYYLVPFYKDNKVSGVAVVGVKDGTGVMGMWANRSGDHYPPVSAAEAKSLVEAKGVTVAGKPQLVFRWLLEGGDETDPFWEVKTTDGTTFYVIHILNATEIYRADEVHIIE